MSVLRSSPLTCAIGIAVGAGGVVLFNHLHFAPRCVFKLLTGVPCPGCGMWRSVNFLLHGELLKSLYANPMGVVVTMVLLVSFLLAVFDVFRHTDLLHRMYHVRVGKWGFAALVLVVVANWAWNISKGY